MKRLCRYLLRKADELRNRDPQRAVSVAETARDLAARIDGDCCSHLEWTALQAESWAVLGSAYRGIADLRRAEGALNVAVRFLQTGESAPGIDPLAQPRLAQRASYLRCDQGRFEEALELNEEAMLSYREVAAFQELAGSLVDRSLILGRHGRAEQAVECLIRALYLLDPSVNPRSYLAAIHNMTLYLCERAQTREDLQEACRWAGLTARQHARFPEDVHQLKLRLLEGTIAIRLGLIDEGLCKLWQAYDGFERLGSAHNQTVVLLQLAQVAMAQGETRDVKRIAGRMLPIFRKLNVDRETSATLMLFYKAAQAEAATQELLQQALGRVGERHGMMQI